MPDALRHPPPDGPLIFDRRPTLRWRMIMSANRALSSPQYLRTPDAALHLGLSPRTLEKHRCYGTGPAFHKLGGRVVYTIDALDSWAALGLRRSTSDPGLGVCLPARRFDGPVRR